MKPTRRKKEERGSEREREREREILLNVSN